MFLFIFYFLLFLPPHWSSRRTSNTPSRSCCEKRAFHRTARTHCPAVMVPTTRLRPSRLTSPHLRLVTHDSPHPPFLSVHTWAFFCCDWFIRLVTRGWAIPLIFLGFLLSRLMLSFVFFCRCWNGPYDKRRRSASPWWFNVETTLPMRGHLIGFHDRTISSLSFLPLFPNSKNYQCFFVFFLTKDNV